MQIVFAMFKLTDFLSCDLDSSRGFDWITLKKIENVRYEGGKKLLVREKVEFHIWLEPINFWKYKFFIWMQIESKAYFTFSQGHLFNSIMPLLLLLYWKIFHPFLWFENRWLFYVMNSKTESTWFMEKTTKLFEFQMHSQFLKSLFLEGINTHEFH